MFEELKLRLGVEGDDDVKRILRRLYNLENPEKQLKENEEDKTYHNIVVGVFQSESITWQSFSQHNLDYLDFPLWLAEKEQLSYNTVKTLWIPKSKKLSENVERLSVIIEKVLNYLSRNSSLKI